MQFSFQSIFCTLSWNLWSFTTVSLHVLQYTILIDFFHVNTQVERDDYRGVPLYSRIHKSSSSSTLPSVKSQGKVGVNIQFMHLISNKFVCDWIIQHWIATMQYLYLLLQCSTYITLMYLYVASNSQIQMFTIIRELSWTGMKVFLLYCFQTKQKRKKDKLLQSRYT